MIENSYTSNSLGFVDAIPDTLTETTRDNGDNLQSRKTKYCYLFSKT